MRPAYPTMPTRRCGAALAVVLALHAGPLAAQEGAEGLDARVRALAAERLAPLLETLERPAAPAPPEGVRFLVRAAGNVQGLAAGAPVTIRGLRVGTVREVTITFDSGKGQLEVPVVIDIVPGSLVVDGLRPDTAEALRAAVATLVGRGLRAQLARPSLLSASQEIALDLVPEAPAASLGDGPVPEIPSLPTRFDAMSATLDRLLAEVGKLPVDRLATEAEATLAALRELATSPELRQSVVDLAAAAGELRNMAGQLAERADPLIDSLARVVDSAGPAAVDTIGAARELLAGPELRQSLANLTALTAQLRTLPEELQARSGALLTSAGAATDQAGQAAVEARRTLVALDQTFGSRSNFQSDLQSLLREVTGATRSLRQLLDLLARQPNVLLRGKSGGPPP